MAIGRGLYRLDPGALILYEQDNTHEYSVKRGTQHKALGSGAPGWATMQDRDQSAVKNYARYRPCHQQRPTDLFDTKSPCMMTALGFVKEKCSMPILSLRLEGRTCSLSADGRRMAGSKADTLASRPVATSNNEGHADD